MALLTPALMLRHYASQTRDGEQGLAEEDLPFEQEPYPGTSPATGFV